MPDISQYIHILNHHAICLKLIQCYMLIMSQYNWEKKEQTKGNFGKRHKKKIHKIRKQVFGKIQKYF